MYNCIKLLGLAVVFAAHVVAVPLTWTLSGVMFNDGGTASGSFTYDATTNTYSNVNITTTTGSARTGATYHFVCGQDVPSCTGVAPNGTQSLNLTTNASNQTGLPAFALFFGPGVPGTGLSNAGGTFSLAGNAQEASCIDAACSSPAPPSRVVTAGSVSAPVTAPPTPIPPTLLLVLTGLALGGFYWWSARLRASRRIA